MAEDSTGSPGHHLAGISVVDGGTFNRTTSCLKGSEIQRFLNINLSSKGHEKLAKQALSWLF